MKAKQSFVNKLTIMIVILLTVVSIQAKDKEKDSCETFYRPSDDKKKRTSRNVIKLNLTQCFLTNPTLQYEIAVHNNISFAVSYAFLIPKKIPNLVWEQGNTGLGWKNGRFNGMSGIIEARYYPGKKEEYQAPHGFYISPYYKYSKYVLTGDYTMQGINSGPNREFSVKGTYSGYAIGAMMGAQFILNDHFSIDIWILGMGFGKAKLVTELSVKDDQPLIQNETYNDIIDKVDELGKFGKGDIKLDVKEKSAVLEVGGLPKSNYRILGFCLGYAF